jgi:hypothetical protein
MADDTVAAPGKKKAAHRSPNYPAFGLVSALEKIRKIYESEKRTPTTADVIVSHLGYKHTDGPGGRALSCLRQFGLLEEHAGKLRVSDVAFSLLHLPDEDAEKAELLKRAALTPNLYRQLREEFPESAPSDPTLKSNLLRRGFNPDSVDGVIADFNATMEVAKAYDVSGNPPEGQSKMQTPPSASGQIPPPNPPAPEPALSGTKVYAFAFAGAGRAELKVVGEYTIEDLEDLKTHLEVTMRALIRSKKTESVQ